LFEAALSEHRKMIKEFQGVPGVKPDRLQEAMKIRHCALSLVGEPIMYPFINEYIQLLHGQDIATFLVTNAQFPDRIRQCKPVTQLYVSVDAPTKDALQKVDRPLFKDFYERFLDSLVALKDKKQRTVYRLTLVKAWNMDDVADYARLVAKGCPSFIEVKGVTFCGVSDGSNLRMDNVPFHMEVRRFCEKLSLYLEDDYELACEHQHSCCCLLARKEFKVDGRWHTWIDYDKFHQLVKSGQEFTAYDYMAETPAWAVWGADEQGFNPQEEKFERKSKKANKKVEKLIEKTRLELESEKLVKPKPEENMYLQEKLKVQDV